MDYINKKIFTLNDKQFLIKIEDTSLNNENIM